jgi:hypothetical protein
MSSNTTYAVEAAAIDVSGSTSYKPSISTSSPVEGTSMTISNAKASGYTKYLYVSRNGGSFSYEGSFTGTAVSYTPSSSDVGKTLAFCFEYASGSGYTGTTVSSNITNAVEAAIIDVSGLSAYKPSISTSSPVKDVSMTISNAMASGYTKYLYVGRNGSFSYEKSFTGTSTTYTPLSSDLGKTLAFYFYYYDSGSGYTGSTVNSNTTNAVTAPLVAPGTAPTGSTIPGYTLTAPTITGTYNYQWYRGSTTISNATGSTYLLTAADIGYQIRVAYTGTGSYTGTVYSNYTTSAVSKIPTGNSDTYKPNLTSTTTKVDKP